MRGNTIERISASPITAGTNANVRVIAANGRVLMPGLIDAHWHAFMAAIADSPDEVRLRAREQLRQGASQIKLMAGGGVNSPYNPIESVQYTEAEIRAAVEVANNWGTYVAVHAITAPAIRQAVAAGVKCIEHGHLIDEPTAKLLADKGIWWSLQSLTLEADRQKHGFKLFVR